MTEPDGPPLSDKVLVSIAKHLNKEHQEDLLACARGLAGLSWAEEARALSLDATGCNLLVKAGPKHQQLRLDFAHRTSGVLAFRREMGRLIAAGRTKLGWEAPREEH